MAIFALFQTLANSLLTFETLALPGVGTFATIVELDSVGVNIPAVSFSFLEV